MLIGWPPGPSGSTIAGMRLLGLIFRNSGLNCSPLEMLIGTTLYGSPISSSATDILRPFGVFQVHNSMAIGGALRRKGQSGRQHYRDARAPQPAMNCLRAASA